MRAVLEIVVVLKVNIEYRLLTADVRPNVCR